MPEITREQAIETITHEICEILPDNEVVVVYNEMFPREKVNPEEARRNPQPLRDRMATAVANSREDGLTRLWSVMIPRHMGIWYNEEDDLYVYTTLEEYQREREQEGDW